MRKKKIIKYDILNKCLRNRKCYEYQESAIPSMIQDWRNVQ